MTKPQRLVLIVIVAAVFMTGCSDNKHEPKIIAERSDRPMIQHKEALQLVEATLAKDGYIPSDFQLDPSGGQTDPASEKWIFVYGCKPVQTEGCFLIVTIDRVSKNTEIFSGHSAKKQRT